jgi:hypothetical protein
VVQRRRVRLRPAPRFWGRRGSWSSGSGLSPPPVALRCGVDLVGCRTVWSLLGAGVWCCVVTVFDQFSL